MRRKECTSAVDSVWVHKCFNVSKKKLMVKGSFGVRRYTKKRRSTGAGRATICTCLRRMQCVGEKKVRLCKRGLSNGPSHSLLRRRESLRCTFAVTSLCEHMLKWRSTYNTRSQEWMCNLRKLDLQLVRAGICSVCVATITVHGCTASGSA